MILDLASQRRQRCCFPAAQRSSDPSGLYLHRTGPPSFSRSSRRLLLLSVASAGGKSPHSPCRLNKAAAALPRGEAARAVEAAHTLLQDGKLQ